MTELKVVPREIESNVQALPHTTSPEISTVVQNILLGSLENASIEKRKFFSDDEKSFMLAVLYSPLTLIFWILAQPVRAFTWAVVSVRSRRYDPTKRVMPCCGFKGDSGTDGKSCRIEFTPTAGPERAGIKHICFRCGCDKHISPLFYKADAWLPREIVKVTKIEKAG